MPAVVKFMFKVFDPVSQVVGSINPKSLPKAPLLNVQPVAGVTVHTNFPGTQVPLSISLATPLVFVIVVMVFTHTVSLGDMTKSATGLCET